MAREDTETGRKKWEFLLWALLICCISPPQICNSSQLCILTCGHACPGDCNIHYKLVQRILATNKLQSLGLPSYSNLLSVLTWLVLVPKDAFCFCAFSSLASLHFVLATAADSQIPYIPNIPYIFPHYPILSSIPC